MRDGTIWVLLIVAVMMRRKIFMAQRRFLRFAPFKFKIKEQIQRCYYKHYWFEWVKCHYDEARTKDDNYNYWRKHAGMKNYFSFTPIFWSLLNIKIIIILKQKYSSYNDPKPYEPHPHTQTIIDTKLPGNIRYRLPPQHRVDHVLLTCFPPED